MEYKHTRLNHFYSFSSWTGTKKAVFFSHIDYFRILHLKYGLMYDFLFKILPIVVFPLRREPADAARVRIPASALIFSSPINRMWVHRSLSSSQSSQISPNPSRTWARNRWTSNPSVSVRQTLKYSKISIEISTRFAKTSVCTVLNSTCHHQTRKIHFYGYLDEC